MSGDDFGYQKHTGRECQTSDINGPFDCIQKEIEQHRNIAEIRARSYILKFNIPYELEVDVTGKNATEDARALAADIASASAEIPKVM